MNAEAATYLDSSALVKLVAREQESSALRRYLLGRSPLMSSALARTEVARALQPLGLAAVRSGRDLLARTQLIDVSEHVLDAAGALLPNSLRSLDAIHLATAQRLGPDLAQLVTYDRRMVAAGKALGLVVVSPA